MVMGGDLNALNTFPITWWTGRPDQESEPDNHLEGHYPYARPVRLGWKQQSDGTWVSSSEDRKVWEVFCEQCGDKDGPAERQPEPARTLRGPYASKHKAEHAAKQHFVATQPA
jgi:hypothetical protein